MFSCFKKSIEGAVEFPREIEMAIVHCSATPDTMNEEESPRWFNLDVEEIRQWHKEGNGWSDIGYHYVIKRDGEIQSGRPLAKAGAHCYGKNAKSIGVCLVGTHTYTEAQKKSLTSVYQMLSARFDLKADKWRCHYEFSHKDCPGFSVDALQAHLDGTKYNFETM